MEDEMGGEEFAGATREDGSNIIGFVSVWVEVPCIERNVSFRWQINTKV
jgi:hypothetical protein